MRNLILSLTALLLIPVSALAGQGELLAMNPLPELTTRQLYVTRSNMCPGTPVKNPDKPVRVFAVTYETRDLKGQPTIATGLIAVPYSDTGIYSVVSYQHGTVLRKDNVPSRLNPEGKAAVACYTAAGYMVVAADYLGYGGNEGFHPYLNAASEGWVTADMLDAAYQARQLLQIKWSGKLFLTGFSQGGHVTMALHRHLQETDSPYKVTASAPLDGAYDLEMSLFAQFNTPSFLTPTLFGYSLWTRFNTTGIFKSLDEAVQQPYADRMGEIFNGTSDWDEVIAALPEKLSDLLQPQFAHDIQNDSNHVYRQMVRENSVHDWTPLVPVRFFHARGDDVAPIANAERTVEHMNKLGATDVKLIDIGNFTHTQAVRPTFEASAAWFETF